MFIMGLRKELVDEITFKLGDEKDRNRKNKISARTSHKLYIEVTGKNAEPVKGRAWHLRKVLEELDIELRKDVYSKSLRIPVTELQELNKHI